mgnify:FL=1
MKYFTKLELSMFILSIILIISSFFIFKNDQYLYLVGSLIGITYLLFLSKGIIFGQILGIIFSIFYGFISYSFKYYGEMITYLCMTTPMAIISLISWIKHPSKKNKNEVEIKELNLKMNLLIIIVGIIVTIIFYFILKALNTSNLIVSTISVFTSFIAVGFTLFRSRFYALGYALNDIVLIILWSLACGENISYLPIVICFVTFFIFDVYGFINWTKMLKNQLS